MAIPELKALRLLCLAALALALGMTPAGAKDGKRRDHDEAYDASRHGKLLPLAEILARVRSTIGDDIVKIELEADDGVPVYEIRFVDKSGRRREIYIDARNARILGEDD
jgi:uncharacterized membrane protein YkoI